MNIASITIRNILGIREMAIEPGKITEIRGRNGSGKSSILGAIRAALGASEYPAAQLIHQGEDSGEVVLVLDDGTAVTRRIKADGTDVKVVDGDGNKFAKPQTVLDQLYAVTQVNPLKLLQTDKKSRDERTRIVLETLPIDVTHDVIRELTPSLNSQIANIDTSRHGLAVLDDIEKRVFDRRTDVNRDFLKSTSAILEMKSALPPDADDLDPVAKLEELRAKKALLDTKREEYVAQFEATRREKREAALAKYNEQMVEAEAVRQEAIRVATEAFEHTRLASAEIKDRAMQVAEEEFEKNKAEKQGAYESRVGPIQSELGRLEELSRNKAAITKQKEILEKMTAENKELAVLADQLSSEIEAVREYRKQQTATMPIKGLRISDGEVYYNGLAFDQLNTAKRLELAVKLAVLRSGKLGVVCVDGCEVLDSETMAMLEQAVSEAGVQMICTSVSDEALSIQVKEVA